MTLHPRQQYAGFWRRVAAMLIDLLLFSLLISLIPMILLRLSQGTLDFWLLESMNSWLFLAACAFCWVRFQGTPGMLMMGCYVVRASDRSAIGVKTAVVRALGYILSFLPLLLGFLWVAWDRRKQGWHDKLAGTLVLQDPHHDISDESQKSLEQLLKELR